jgi:DNA excision repair protein ERCC-2
MELSQTVPDGIVCFFPSYRYMEDIIFQWNEMSVLEKILEYKVLYIESKDVTETSLSLAHYRKACDIGRGAIFLSVARGKVAEGIDFNNHYGRCVIMFGMPFQYTKCRILNERMNYLKNHKGIPKEDFLIFDAMRQCAQCLGRVIRNKNDYGLMVLADKRYSRNDKKDKLPSWIKQAIDPAYTNLTIDMANYIARDFFKQMA